MAGIIFNELRVTPVARCINRRRFIAVASGAVASIATHSALARHEPGTPTAMLDKVDDIGGGGPEQLIRLLAHVPIDLLSRDEGNGMVFSYADLAQQLDSVGVQSVLLNGDRPSTNPLLALSPLAMVSPVFRWAFDEAFTAAIGFQPLQTGQVLLAGAPPDELTLFLGGMDLDRLPTAWEAIGYESLPTDDGVAIWTIGKNGEINLESPMGAFGMPSLNNATVLDNGIVMFAQQYDRLVSVAHLVRTGMGSMLDDEATSSVVDAMPVDTVSVIAVAPDYVVADPLRSRNQVTPDQDVEVEEGEQMPAYRLFVMGITAGFIDPDVQPDRQGTPDASPVIEAQTVVPDGGVIFARLSAESEEDATLIAAIVGERWNEQSSLVLHRPYADLMTVKEARTKGKIAALDFVPGLLPSVWIRLILQRDLAPFAPNP